jgi:putative acetyltransferase
MFHALPCTDYLKINLNCFFITDQLPLHLKSIRIASPQNEAEQERARDLLVEYANSLKIDLCFQGFENELANFPGEYSQPRGSFRLAWFGDELAGCCAVRQLDSVDYPNACEMKRLYVSPAFRNLHIGRMLTQDIMDQAKIAGYETILLDTLDDMEAARTLYHDLGFVEVPPYYHNPIAGAHYLKASL